MSMVVLSTPRVSPFQARYQIAKRVMDLVLCLLALPLILLLMAVCALAVYLDSPGSIFFVQERVGKGCRPFKMYKFRTMQHEIDDRYHRAFMKAFVRGEIGTASGIDHRRAFIEAFACKSSSILTNTGSLDESENQAGIWTMGISQSDQKVDGAKSKEVYKPARAAQITRVGRFLRKTSLDELPQIINVLKGEMSLVGPRPNVPWEVEEYQPWHYERLEVLPGLTGLAQVRGRSDISFDRIVKYDVEYVEKQSLAMDFKILCWTVKSVVDGKGAG
jgi:lipopolysaccharide/colanic/teichoic acid biosynthesis glycosyltransferase